MNVEELVPAIRNSDLARLTRIPGVGRKTAERMVVELKDKLEAVVVETEKASPPSPAGVEADVKSALVNLGYEERIAESAVAAAKRETGKKRLPEIDAQLAHVLRPLTEENGSGSGNSALIGWRLPGADNPSLTINLGERDVTRGTVTVPARVFATKTL